MSPFMSFPGDGTHGRPHRLRDRLEAPLPPPGSRRTVDLLRGRGEGLFGGHALEEQDVHDARRLPVRPVAPRDGVQVAADEPPVEAGVVEDANRHREEGDPVAAAPGPIPGQLAGDGPTPRLPAQEVRRGAPPPPGGEDPPPPAEGGPPPA